MFPPRSRSSGAEASDNVEAFVSLPHGWKKFPRLMLARRGR